MGNKEGRADGAQGGAKVAHKGKGGRQSAAG